MAEDNIVQRIKRWKPMSKRPTGWPKTRWEDDVLEGIKNVNVRNWKKVAQNRASWKKVVEQARTLYRLWHFIRRRRRRSVIIARVWSQSCGLCVCRQLAYSLAYQSIWMLVKMDGTDMNTTVLFLY